MARIPQTITRDQLVEATKPLLELLGTNAFEILDGAPIVICDGSIRFTVVAAKDGDDATFPAGVSIGGHPQGDEFALLTHSITVRVVD